MARQHLTGECVAFDIETTGFAAAGGHEVTAVGFVGFDCGEEAGLEQEYIPLYVAEIREIESDTREIFLGRLQPYAEMIEERR